MRRDEGAAVIELVVVVVLLLVPVTFAAVALYRAAQVQRVADELAATLALGVARGTTAPADADRLARLAGWEAGLSAPPDAHVRCAARLCGRPGSRVEVIVTAELELPLLHDVLHRDIAARHVEVIDRFAETPQ